MAHTLIERPASFCMSKNEIRYVFLVTDLTRVGLYLEVQLFYRRGDATVDSSFPSFKLIPNPDGTVDVTLQQYIDSLLEYVMPISSTATSADKQYCSFYVATRDVDDSTVGTLPWVTLEISNKRIALKMGVEENRYSRNNLLNYLATNKLFLTYQPIPRKVFDTQPLFLSFILPDGNTTNISLYVTWKTIQGTTNSTTIALPALTGYLYHAAVDITTLGLTMPSGETLYYWEVSVINFSTFTVIISPYRFYKDYRPLYNFHDFIFINSLGGIDTARAAGETTFTIERTFDVAEGGFQNNNSSAVVKSQAIKQVNINLQRKWKGDLGFRQNKEEQLGLMDLLLCLVCYTIIDGRWVPLLNIQTSQEFFKTTDTKWSFPIEWQLAETNLVYTPERLALGIASDTETYDGYVWLTNEGASTPISTITGITGFALPTVGDTDLIYEGDEYVGVHTAALNATDITVTPYYDGISPGPAGNISLYVNGILIQTLAFLASAVSFTTSHAIAKADLIEFVVN